MFGLIWPPTTPEAVKQSVIDTLAELEALRGQEKGLAEDEYAGWRKSILDELATNRHPEPVFLIASVPLGLIMAGGFAWALSAGRNDMACGFGCGVVFVVLLAIRFARGLAAKRRLTVADRLELVAELARRELVTVDEATELGQRIALLE
jgi:hypothetical protein